jgi:nicotinamide riboside kinase
MKIVEFIAGPGAGKTTLATKLFSTLKGQCIQGLDFSREMAQEAINMGNKSYLDNQLLLLGLEYQKRLTCSKGGCQLLVTDTSVQLSRFYNQNKEFRKPISNLSFAMRHEFDTITVLVGRDKPFQSYGRAQTEKEVLQIDKWVSDNCIIDYKYTGDFDHFLNFIHHFRSTEFSTLTELGMD